MTYQYIIVKSNIVSLQGEFIGINVIMQKVAELIHTCTNIYMQWVGGFHA